MAILILLVLLELCSLSGANLNQLLFQTNLLPQILDTEPIESLLINDDANTTQVNGTWDLDDYDDDVAAFDASPGTDDDGEWVRVREPNEEISWKRRIMRKRKRRPTHRLRDGRQHRRRPRPREDNRKTLDESKPEHARESTPEKTRTAEETNKEQSKDDIKLPFEIGKFFSKLPLPINLPKMPDIKFPELNNMNMANVLNKADFNVEFLSNHVNNNTTKVDKVEQLGKNTHLSKSSYSNSAPNSGSNSGPSSSPNAVPISDPHLVCNSSPKISLESQKVEPQSKEPIVIKMPQSPPIIIKNFASAPNHQIVTNNEESNKPKAPQSLTISKAEPKSTPSQCTSPKCETTTVECAKTTTEAPCDIMTTTEVPCSKKTTKASTEAACSKTTTESACEKSTKQQKQTFKNAPKLEPNFEFISIRSQNDPNPWFRQFPKMAQQMQYPIDLKNMREFPYYFVQRPQQSIHENQELFRDLKNIQMNQVHGQRYVPINGPITRSTYQQSYSQINSQNNGHSSGQSHGQSNDQSHIQSFGHINGQINDQSYEQSYSQINSQTNDHSSGQSNGHLHSIGQINGDSIGQKKDANSLPPSPTFGNKFDQSKDGKKSDKIEHTEDRRHENEAKEQKLNGTNGWSGTIQSYWEKHPMLQVNVQLQQTQQQAQETAQKQIALQQHNEVTTRTNYDTTEGEIKTL